MAEVNGKLTITALVPTSEGNKEIRLQGTRLEVDAQLKSLPTEIQSIIRPQIRF